MSDESVGGFALKWSMRPGLGGGWFLVGDRPGSDPQVGLPAVRIHVQNVAGTDPSAKEVAEHLQAYFDAEVFQGKEVWCETVLAWHPVDGSDPVEIPVGEPWVLPGTDVRVGEFRLSTREVPGGEEATRG